MQQTLWKIYNKLKSLSKGILVKIIRKPLLFNHIILISTLFILVAELTIFLINHSANKTPINNIAINTTANSMPANISATTKNLTPALINGVNENAQNEKINAQPKEKVITILKRDNLNKIFVRLGLKIEDAKAILKLPSAKALRNLRVGQKMTISLSNNNQLDKITVPINITDTLTVSKNKGKFQSRISHIEPTPRIECASLTVNRSLYASAKKANVPRSLINKLTVVLKNKVNLAKFLRDGDKVALMYKDYYVNGKKINKNSDLVAAEYTHNKKTYKIVSFTDRSGHTSFYTSEGYALSSPFTRYPLSFKRIASSFSYNRYNPVLHIYREHTGVDLAANIGTPIKATSNGVISFAGKEGGYGNVVKIKHNNYSTLYAHMLRFASGVRTGNIVHQGQTIGYVGMSGMTTGPHLHYEFRINNTPYDPLKVKLPMDEMIAQSHRSQFYKQQKNLFAQLDSYLYAYAEKENDPIPKATNTVKKKV